MGTFGFVTTSLLCALENVGYGRLDRDSRKEAVAGRFALSTLGMENLLLGDPREEEVDDVEERVPGMPRSRSLVEVRLARPWV